MKEDRTIRWLLRGDVSIRYQTHLHLLQSEKTDLRNRISQEGWGARFLSERNPDGYWGRGYYQPKWTSTHYTLLDLKHLGISPVNRPIRESITLALEKHRADDGGIYPIGAARTSDVCLNGMFLNVACYFRVNEKELQSIVDFLLAELMRDGGFNCNSNRSGGARHSSLHTTISVLEGILEYRSNGYRYRLDELEKSEKSGIEFLLRHRLFRSHRNGEIIDAKMLLLSWPSRWRYDILRVLDYFYQARIRYDPRMDDALMILLKKRRMDGTWPLQGRHPGATHFEMEKPGMPSRWNTLRAFRVLRHFEIGGGDP